MNGLIKICTEQKLIGMKILSNVREVAYRHAYILIFLSVLFTSAAGAADTGLSFYKTEQNYQLIVADKIKGDFCKAYVKENPSGGLRQDDLAAVDEIFKLRKKLFEQQAILSGKSTVLFNKDAKKYEDQFKASIDYSVAEAAFWKAAKTSFQQSALVGQNCKILSQSAREELPYLHTLVSLGQNSLGANKALTASDIQKEAPPIEKDTLSQRDDLVAKDGVKNKETAYVQKQEPPTPAQKQPPFEESKSIAVPDSQENTSQSDGGGNKEAEVQKDIEWVSAFSGAKTKNLYMPYVILTALATTAIIVFIRSVVKKGREKYGLSFIKSKQFFLQVAGLILLFISMTDLANLKWGIGAAVSGVLVALIMNIRRSTLIFGLIYTVLQLISAIFSPLIISLLLLIPLYIIGSRNGEHRKSYYM